MNSLDLFLDVGKAVRIIFYLGFLPKEDDFVEFSEQDYKEYQQEEGPVDCKMFSFRKGLVDESKGMLAFGEEDKASE